MESHRPGALGCVALATLLLLGGCGGIQVDESPAWLLAVADTGDPEPGDAVVAEYQAAIDAMEETCVPEADTSHGDYAITVKRLLADEGIPMSALIVLESMAEAADALRTEGVSCVDAYTLFTTLVVSDQ